MQDNQSRRHAHSIHEKQLAVVMANGYLASHLRLGERAHKQVKDYTYPLTMTAWSSFFSLGEHALLT